ncbi:hypothetical protein J2S18_001964 [Eubacterium multiforme]|uniref:Uncharacterized protein n=1 Tax=Eubacterium multiforme TaxID=83339 RepID=A0ABT9UUN5_9FIRM|nr:hypothetical protein [Eubacterium multiforme]
MRNIGYIIFILPSIYIIWSRGITGYLKCLIKYSAPIAVLLFNLTNLTIIDNVQKLLGLNMLPLSSTARIAVDSAIITLIFNFIAQSINSPASIKTFFKNRVDLKQLRLRIDKISKVDLEIFVDYKYKLLQTIIRKLDGIIYIVIKNTDWTSITVSDLDQYDYINYDNPSKEICVDITNKNNKKIYLTLEILSNKSIKNEDYISTDIRVICSKKIYKFFLKKIVIIFFDLNFDKQEVVYRKE